MSAADRELREAFKKWAESMPVTFSRTALYDGNLLEMAWQAAWREAQQLERDRCAKIAEGFNDGDEAVMVFPNGIARAIRARVAPSGEETK